MGTMNQKAGPGPNAFLALVSREINKRGTLLATLNGNRADEEGWFVENYENRENSSRTASRLFKIYSFFFWIYCVLIWMIMIIDRRSFAIVKFLFACFHCGSH